MSKEMILTFGFDGSVKKETVGFKGTSCTKDTEFIEIALGTAKDDRKLKSEYYEKPNDQQESLRIKSSN